MEDLLHDCVRMDHFEEHAKDEAWTFTRGGEQGKSIGGHA